MTDGIERGYGPGSENWREADWYVLGPKPSPFKSYNKKIVKHWWVPPVEGGDGLWKTLCGARVIGDKHRQGLRRGFDTRMNSRCIDCDRRKHDLPPIFPKVMK